MTIIRLQSEKSFPDNTHESENKKTTRRPAPEKPKPWTKKERIFVFSTLALTSLISAVLGFTARKGKLPGVPVLNFPSISLEETYTIQKENGEMKIKSNDDIISKIQAITSALSGVYGIYVVDLNGENSYSINENHTFQAASLVKLPVMAGSLYESDKRTLNLKTKHTLNETDKIAGSGSLYYQPAGSVVTYQKLIEMMGKESDNTAFGIMSDVLGSEKIETHIKRLGMTNTSIDKNKTTPKDIASFFKHITKDNYLSQTSADLLLSYLTDTIYENFLPASLPDDIKVAHKFGRELHVINDAGVVYATNPYIVVILSEGVMESEAEIAIPKISELIYQNALAH